MLPETETRYLAIDYGSKRIGLALSDPFKIFAYPFLTIPNNDKTSEEIQKIISEKGIIKIIIGLPYKEDGRIGELGSIITKFADSIRKSSSLEIEFWDERYSSSIASERILASGIGKKARRDKALIDKNAAAVILQEYMDSKK
ncbi:MAG: Holliday junction resolvase RuvX [Ignavibacteriaceae bacterium]